MFLHDAIYCGQHYPPRSYHSVTPNAPSPEGGGGVSEMLLDKETRLDNFLQQSCQCGFGSLASRAAQLVVLKQFIYLTLSRNLAVICCPV